MANDDEIFDLRSFTGRLKTPGGRNLIWIAGFVFAFFLLTKMITVIPAGHVGIKDFFGKVSNKTMASGIHLMNPLLRIHKMSIRTQEVTEEANVPSREGLSMKLDVSLLFNLDQEKAADVYKTLGPDYVRIVVIPQLRSIVRGVTASYDAKALYTAERETISTEMFNQLQPILRERAINVEKILLRSVTLPDILATAIQKKLEAEQQSEQMKFVLLKEEQEAERKRVEAKGVADFQRIVTSGLTTDFLRWKGIEATAKLADSQNSKIVVIGGGKDGLPIILGGQDN
ncbi:MAG: prohibitin family protein [Deltaproteobacteria bacterium]|nr:prohibitin family protein [Deltaproteobacteria bacterium]